MMSLFWYYRPEDAKGTNISDYHEVLYFTDSQAHGGASHRACIRPAPNIPEQFLEYLLDKKNR